MNLLIGMAGLMVALLLFNWRMVVAMLQQLNIKRKVPGQVTAGYNGLAVQPGNDEFRQVITANPTLGFDQGKIN